MAIPWLVLLKTVPWTDVIANAPAVANGAKKLWNTVSGKSPAAEAPRPEVDIARLPENEALAAMQSELRSLRTTTRELHQQMLASSELIQDLAEQNTALIKRVETYRVRLLWLTGVVVLLLALVLAGFFMN